MTKRFVYVCVGLMLATLARVAQADTLLIESGDTLMNRGGLQAFPSAESDKFRSNQPWILLAQGEQISPCDDPRYLALKTVPLDSMTQRQYEYFQQKDKDCTEFRRSQLNQPRASSGTSVPQAAPAPAPANSSMGPGTVVVLAILGTIAFFVILGAIAQ